MYDTSTGYIIAWAQLNPKPTIALLAGGMVKEPHIRVEYTMLCYAVMYYYHILYYIILYYDI